MTDRLVGALAQYGLTAADIADVLWLLAARDENPAPDDPRPPAAPDSLASSPPRSTSGSNSQQPVPRSPTPEDTSPEPGGAQLYLGGLGSAPASRIGLPYPGTFGHPLRLARALRPFTHVREAGEQRFDLDGSVEATAEAGALVALFRPEQRRRLDVALVTDDSVSVTLFGDAIDELARIFADVGAFRAVTCWTLVADAGAKPTWTAAPVRDARGELHPADHLIDPTARRIVLLVTDFVGAHWAGVKPWNTLERWARTMPTAVLHTLPERYWRDTAIGHSTIVTRTHWSDPSNPAPRIHQPRWSHQATTGTQAVPVVALTPNAVATWVQAAVDGTGWTRATLTTHRPSPLRIADETATPADLIAAFRARASKPAQRLAEVLALSPLLSMPLINLLRTAMVPEADTTAVAEIFVSGLLTTASGDAPSTAAGHQYRFRDGVAARLRRGTTAAEHRAAYDAVTAYLDTHLTSTGSQFYDATTANPTGTDTLDPELQPFAAILYHVDGRRAHRAQNNRGEAPEPAVRSAEPRPSDGNPRGASGPTPDDRTSEEERRASIPTAVRPAPGSDQPTTPVSQRAGSGREEDSPAPGPTVAEAYAACEEITKQAAKNFAWGIRLLPADRRGALSAVYAFSRRLDDIGDGDLPDEQKAEGLAKARADIRALDPNSSDPVIVALADAARRFPIPLEAFIELADGVERDIVPTTYDTFDDMVGYCRLVAGTIGRLSLGIFGTTESAGHGDAPAIADALGVAMQQTNILRDVREDLLNGRIYLPQAELAAAGVNLAVDADGRLGGPEDALVDYLRACAARAQEWYDRGLVLLGMLDRRSAACCGAMAGIYLRLNRRIQTDPTPVLTRRLSLPGREKAVVAVRNLAGRPVQSRGGPAGGQTTGHAG